MATNENLIPIPGRLHSVATEGHVAGADEIFDDNLSRLQQDINEEVAAVPYNASTPNGMGKIVLKKNDNFKQVVEAQTDGNTIFVIKYDFTLTGNVTIPANCVLEFDGGSVSGARTLTGTNTSIQAGLVKIFNTNITFAGTWNIKEYYPEWFGAKGDGITDDSDIINKTIDFASPFSTVVISDETSLSSPIVIDKQVKLKANNTIYCDDCDGIIVGTLENGIIPDIEISDITSCPKGQSWGIDDVNAKYNNSAIIINNGAVGRILFKSIKFFENAIDFSPLYDTVRDVRKNAAENRVYGGTIQRCENGVIIRHSGPGTEGANVDKRGWAEGNTIEASIFGCDKGIYIEENALATYTNLSGVIDCAAGKEGSAKTTWDIYSNIRFGIISRLYFVRYDRIYDKNKSESIYEIIPKTNKSIIRNTNFFTNGNLSLADSTRTSGLADIELGNVTAVRVSNGGLTITANSQGDIYTQFILTNTVKVGYRHCEYTMYANIKSSIAEVYASVWYSVNGGSLQFKRSFTKNISKADPCLFTFDFSDIQDNDKLDLKFVRLYSGFSQTYTITEFSFIEGIYPIQPSSEYGVSRMQPDIIAPNRIVLNSYPDTNFTGWYCHNGIWNKFGVFHTSGNTRPTGSLQVGTVHFDTSPNHPARPIWWNGSAWVDATGATV